MNFTIHTALCARLFTSHIMEWCNISFLEKYINRTFVDRLERSDAATIKQT